MEGSGFASRSIVNLLLIHEGAGEALALEQAFSYRADIRTAATIQAALSLIENEHWHPELVVADTSVRDLGDSLLVVRLRKLLDGTPLIIGVNGSLPLIEARLWSGNGVRPKRNVPGAPRISLETIFEEQQALAQSISNQRMQLGTEIERAAAKAAETAVNRAIEQLVTRLGVEDAEGFRLAIRLARAWEAAKGKFFSALTTGIASAFLLALGAGIISMLRHTETK